MNWRIRRIREAKGVLRLLAPVVLAAWVTACASSSSTTKTTPEVAPGGAAPPQASTPPGSPTPPGGATPGSPTPPVPLDRRYRFHMESPANDDFAFNDDEIFIYVRPYEEHLSMKVQARELNHTRILWSDSEFVDIVGRRYRLVPPTTTIQGAASGIVPPTDIAPGQLFSGLVLLLDPAEIQTIRALGAKHFPVVPLDAGTPEQIKNAEFTLRLAIELNSARRDYDFVFSIRDTYYR